MGEDGGQTEHRAGKGGYFRQEETHGGKKAQDAHGWVLVGRGGGEDSPHSSIPTTGMSQLCVFIPTVLSEAQLWGHS